MIYEWFKRFRPAKIKPFNGCHYFTRPPVGIINRLRFIYFHIRYEWSIPDGPVFIVKLWIWILDHLCGRFYSSSQNPICRSPNHSSVLSRKQNIGWSFIIKYFLYKTIPLEKFYSWGNLKMKLLGIEVNPLEWALSMQWFRKRMLNLNCMDALIYGGSVTEFGVHIIILMH